MDGRGARPSTASARWTLTAAGLATFLLTLGDTAPAVAMPAIGRDLGLSVRGLEWVVNAHTLAVAVFLLTGGALADRLGARPVFVAGLGVTTLGALAAGLAPTGDLLIAARTVQGVGGALVTPTALALVSGSVRRERRGLALGLWTAASASALALGPLVGAALAEFAGWRWIFLLNVPLGLAMLALAGRLLETDGRRRRLPPLDRAGLAVSAVVLFTVVFALTETSSRGWASPLVLGLLASGAVGAALFVRLERRAAAPLLDLSLLRRRGFLGANAVTLLSTSVMCSVFFFLSLYLQLQLRFTPIGAGSIFLPMTGVIFAVSPLAGRLSDQVGRRPVVAAGLLLLALGLLLLSQAGLNGDLAPLLIALAIVGLGVALAGTPATAAGLDAAPPQQQGLASGVLNTSRMIGLALGIASMGTIVAAQWPRGFTESGPRAFAAGLALAFLINAAISAATAILALVALPTKTARAKAARPRRRRRSAQEAPAPATGIAE